VDNKDQNYGGGAAGTKTETDNTAASGGALGLDRGAGFADFRAWVNQMIGRVHTEIPYDGADREVTELTVDGQLRIKHGEGFSLVPLNSATAPDLFRNWISLLSR
jgi:hypothetical protein